MTAGRKQGAGCWTCRLRRKRCDSAQPICGACQSLDITCHSGEAKPSWMDGGAGQKHMSEAIKAKIKKNALVRRERRLLSHEDQSIILLSGTEPLSNTDFVSALAPSRVIDDAVGHMPRTGLTASTLTISDVRPTTHQLSTDQFQTSQSPLASISSRTSTITLPNGSSTESSLPAGLAAPIQQELGSVMIYLDYVFPFLFPFYQPSLIETGRQWLLGLLCQNEVSFHIAASLSAYFFSLVPQKDGQDMHDDCKALVRGKLLEQMDVAFRSIQSTVSAFSQHGSESSLLGRIRIIEEITQLLIVEMTVKRDVDWKVHLTPAIVLFDEIFMSHGSAYSEPTLAILLSALPSPFPMGTPHHKPLPNTADQSGLVFFVSLLIFVDVIASTSLGTAPTLHKHHDSLLSSEGGKEVCVRSETVLGCQNWALVAIGNISALCSWKRDAKKNGNFSVVDLVKLAEPISQALEEGLARLDMDTTHLQSEETSASRLEAYYSRHDREIDSNSIANITRIWAHAAKVYLSVCLSGWQPKSTDIQASVVKVLSLIQPIDSPAQLRSLSWPICVAGCLALPSQEDAFRRIVGSMGQLGEFGTIYNALRIMEAVWRSRATIDGSFWDIQSCLNILGSSALLI